MHVENPCFTTANKNVKTLFLHMKFFLLLLAILAVMPIIGRAQSAASSGASPAKQTIRIYYDTPSLSLTIQPPPSHDGITPFVPLEFVGNWPPNSVKIIIKILNTESDLDEATIKDNSTHSLLFTYGSATTHTVSESNNTINSLVSDADLKGASSDIKKAGAKASNDLKSSGAVKLDDIYDQVELVREAGKNEFAILMAAPDLRRYYGVQIIIELSAGASLYTNTNAGSTRGVPVLYSGHLDSLQSERFLPYASYGCGFLDINHSATPFFVTSAGLIWTVRPVYSGFRKPFFHRYQAGAGAGAVGQWLLNRTFLSAGIGTTSLNDRGRTLATSTIKGTGGVGFFFAPGLGIAFEYTIGGSVNPNPDFDNRTKGFAMPGVSLRLTGQVKDLFVGKVTDTQPQK